MDFDRLPDHFFLRVLQYLPFKEQCRIGVLGKSFRRTSEAAISQTRWLLLEHPYFETMTRKSLSKIFTLCQKKLENTSVPGKFIKLFTEFSFPRLEKIELSLNGDGRGFRFVDLITANNPALKSLSLSLFSDDKSRRFASTGVALTSLEELIISGEKYFVSTKDRLHLVLDGHFLRALTGRCPNLKRLTLLHCKWRRGAQHSLDNIFTHCAALEELQFSYVRDLDFFQMDSFWRMRSLQRLTIESICPLLCTRGDDFLVKVGKSFAHLQELRVHGLQITDRGLDALLPLNDLARIDIRNGNRNVDMEPSLVELAQNGKLKYVDIDCDVSPSTFLTIINKCPNLEYFQLNCILNVDNPYTAAELISSLGRWNQTLKIHLKYLLDKYSDYAWQSHQVLEALEELKDNPKLDVKIDLYEKEEEEEEKVCKVCGYANC